MSSRILTLVIAEGALLLAVVPRTLRESTSSYFDPPPAVHPHLPDPSNVEVDDDASPRDKRAAGLVRAVLSFALFVMLRSGPRVMPTFGPPL